MTRLTRCASMSCLNWRPVANPGDYQTLVASLTASPRPGCDESREMHAPCAVSQRAINPDFPKNGRARECYPVQPV